MIKETLIGLLIISLPFVYFIGLSYLIRKYIWKCTDRQMRDPGYCTPPFAMTLAFLHLVGITLLMLGYAVGNGFIHILF